MRTALLLTVVILTLVSCTERLSEHYDCWKETEEEVIDNIERHIYSIATLEVKSAPISLVIPDSGPFKPADDESIFGVEFEHSSEYGVPLWGKAVVTYKKESCEMESIRVAPEDGFFEESNE